VSPPRRPSREVRRRSWREAPFASLDFETTGLDVERDHIVSFGVVPIDHARAGVGRSVHQLVSPAAPSSVVSMKVHGILPRDIEDAPAIEQARELLRSSLDGRLVLAWFAGIELAFLRRSFGGSERSWRRRTIDVLDLVVALERPDPDARFSLSVTAERYDVPVADPHSALDDALVTAQLFLVVATRLEERGVRTVRDLLHLRRR
jgi:DNA polymerase III subunit epsilon